MEFAYYVLDWARLIALTVIALQIIDVMKSRK